MATEAATQAQRGGGREAAGRGREGFRYDAFLSYSHADMLVAREVQHGLRRLATSRFAASSLSVFRDDTNLASTPTLWPSIAAAIEQSRHLVVLASPSAARSEWVNREIDHFLEQTPRRPIHVVLVSGTLRWDDDRGHFDEASDALPPSLRDAFDEEPLILDLRPGVVWSLADKAFREVIARLAAPMRGVTPEELHDIERQLQRRALGQAGAAIALLVVLLLAAVATGVVAHRAQRTAESNAAQAAANEDQARRNAAESEENAAEARDNAARALASYAEALATSRPALALGLAAEAVERLRVPETVSALAYSHLVYSQTRGLPLAVLTERTDTMPTMTGDAELSFSPDGRALAVGGPFSPVDIWDLETRRVSATIDAGEARGTGVAFSPDGTALATGTGDGATVWDVRSGEATAVLVGHTARVIDVAFSPDGSLLATASEDGTAKLWDLGTGQEATTLSGHLDPDPERNDTFLPSSDAVVIGVAFSPDGSTLATTGNDAAVRLWDVGTGEQVRSLRGHVSAVRGVAFSPDGSLLATASNDHTARVWDLRSGQELHTLGGHTDLVETVAFSPDGRTLATASWDGTGRLWDLVTGVHVASLLGHTSYVSDVAFSPDGRTVATVSWDGSARLWNPGPRGGVAFLRGHARRTLGVAFSPDGQLLATTSADGIIKVWSLPAGTEVATFTGPTAMVGGVAFSPDGRLLATASWDGTAQLWDPRTGRQLTMLVRDAVPGEARASPAEVGRAIDEVDQVRRAFGEMTAVGGVAFSPDGRLLATPTIEETVVLWDTSTHEAVATLTGHSDLVSALAFDADGEHLATASWDSTVRLWDPSTGDEVDTMTPGMRGVNGVAFSVDGRLAAALEDGTSALWPADHRQGLNVLSGHGSHVAGEAFSPDGALLATTGGDRQTMLWDGATGERIATLTGHADQVVGVAFSPDGDLLATTSNDGSVQVRTLLLDPREACALLGGHLTTEELTAALGDESPRACTNL